MANVPLILLVLSFVCFCIATAGVSGRWVPAGLTLYTASLLAGLL